MISKCTNDAEQVRSNVPGAKFQECAKRAHPKRYSERTCEPQRIVLDSVETALLDQIVEARVMRGAGDAADVRAYLVKEIVACGLLHVGRADGLR